MTAESPSINRQRRRFGIGLGVGLGAATAVSSAARAATARVAATALPSLVKPRALRTGDLVALVAPGGVVDDALIEKGVRNLESIGLRVLLAPHLRARHGNFAGTVRERLADLHALLEHREVTALWALRGGSGCASLPCVRLLRVMTLSLGRETWTRPQCRLCSRISRRRRCMRTWMTLALIRASSLFLPAVIKQTGAEHL